MPEITDPAVLEELIPRIIGPVHKSGGWSWVRHENGFQACWRRISEQPPAGATSHLSATLVFPEPFVDVPFVAFQAVEPGGSGNLAGAKAARYPYRDATTASGTRIMALAQGSDTFSGTAPLVTDVIAVGFWK